MHNRLNSYKYFLKLGEVWLVICIYLVYRSKIVIENELGLWVPDASSNKEISSL